MNRWITYISAVCMGALYLVSTMGYGVHECSRSGNRNVVLLFGVSPCEYVHSHRDGRGHLYTHCHVVCPGHVHGHAADAAEKCGSRPGGAQPFVRDGIYCGGCCHTTVYVLDGDQNIQDRSQVPVPEGQAHGLYACLFPEPNGRSVFPPGSGSAGHFLPEIVKATRARLSGLACWRL